MTQRKGDASQLDTDVQAHIGRQLRAGYVDILNQPVPDRFLELLAELDRRQDPGDRDEDVRQNRSR
ncbi:NepR family anti-sigma factor [Chenggangzhangella methanolivorans]|uniref:Anti-sigma factor NepR domain-containing protein n=1 Tax=Chenggangzhangella methanolivorans TaxID=1437009 RepID=A0A9E6UQR5_9HYPH|nr:NepR family anti-sigma factor [Chenggangzhangella methanolivorans]QZO01355.1 hypothetical protein K6K41_07755 [Chenggangzhangella methanolivorans]